MLLLPKPFPRKGAYNKSLPYQKEPSRYTCRMISVRDFISGTIQFVPAGKTTRQAEKNLGRLTKFMVELGASDLLFRGSGVHYNINWIT